MASLSGLSGIDEMGQMHTLGDTLIPTINKLQDIFGQVRMPFKLDLPQVAVVGSQSSGKSSVLEALVGRDFLPRGPDICTRRPLVLQLVRCNWTPNNSSKVNGGQARAANGSNDTAPQEWGEFLHLPGRKIYDFAEIRQEIENETTRMLGGNKAISDVPIRLKIYSPKVLTMSLVDLPGIARNAVGDQPTDIETRLKSMVQEYIRHPTCIILAVSSANVDLANSDALSLAQLWDKSGERTIGVLTKLDIMDRGTDAGAILRNQTFPLKLGYVAVVNRSQGDIDDGTDMRWARQKETDFFGQHPVYSQLMEHCGVDVLARRLNCILVGHIRAVLPALRLQMERQLAAKEVELAGYGEAPPTESATARGTLLLKLLSEYAENYAQLLDGKREDLHIEELAGGAKIRHIFVNSFRQALSEVHPATSLNDHDIMTAIKNSAGVEGMLLIPTEPFELLVKKAIRKLLQPALECQALVYEELLRIAAMAAPKDMDRFPYLARYVSDAVADFIREGSQPCEQMLRHLVDCEHAYVNIEHPDFIGGSRAIARVMERHSQGLRGWDPSLLDEAATRGMPHGSGFGTASVVDDMSAGLKGITELYPYRSDRGLPIEDGDGPLLPHTQGVALAGGALQGAPSASLPHNDKGSWLSFWHRDTAAEKGKTAVEAEKAPQSEEVEDEGGIHPQEAVIVDVTRLLVEDYFRLVRRTFQDLVPKALMMFMVNNTRRGMQQHLIRMLYKEDLFDEMLREQDDITQKRTTCQALISVLKNALAVLDQLPKTMSHSMKGYSDPHAHGHRGLATKTFALPTRAPLSLKDRHPSIARAAQVAAEASAQLVGLRPAEEVFGFGEPEKRGVGNAA